MTEEEEKTLWQTRVRELQAVMTIAQIAEFVGVDDREVFRWKAGERRPMGMKAVRVYVLHVKRCPERQWRIDHVQATGKSAM